MIQRNGRPFRKAREHYNIEKKRRPKNLRVKERLLQKKRLRLRQKRQRRLQGRRAIKRVRTPTIQQPLMRPRKLLYCFFRTLIMETLMG